MKRRISPSLFAGGAFAVIVALLVSGCPTGADLENPRAYNTKCDAPTLFLNNCSGAACHGEVNQTEPPLNTDLVSPGLEARLINVPADYSQVRNQAACPVDNPELLVNAKNPEQSLLLLKLEDKQACGTSMPYSAPLLAQDQIDCVREWVISIVGGLGGAGGAGGESSTGGVTATGGATGTGGVVATGGTGGTL